MELLQFRCAGVELCPQSLLLFAIWSIMLYVTGIYIVTWQHERRYALLSSFDVPEDNDITRLTSRLLIHQFVKSVSRKRKHTQNTKKRKTRASFFDTEDFIYN